MAIRILPDAPGLYMSRRRFIFNYKADAAPGLSFRHYITHIVWK